MVRSPDTRPTARSPWPAQAPLLLLLLGTAAAALAIAFLQPLGRPMPGYFADAQLWATQGRIADTFTPLLYPLFIGPALRLAGAPGVIALQAVLQLAIASIAWLALRELGLSPIAAALGAVPVAFHPDLLGSITKAWDVSLSTALLLLFVVLCLALLRARERSLATLGLAAGLALGLGIACRPNYLLLSPCLLVALWLRSARPSLRRAAVVVGAATAGAVVTFSLAGVLSHGSIFLPRNGVYNLFAGHNRYTAAALRKNLNAEPSLVHSLKDRRATDPAANPDPYAAANGPWYRAETIRFARTHPAAELVLIPLKLWTLFRPDTKVHALTSPLGIFRVLLALPIVLLLAAALLPPRPRLLPADALLILFEALYVLPFLITNSDPRFRTPLDMLLLLHTASLVWRRRRRSTHAA